MSIFHAYSQNDQPSSPDPSSAEKMLLNLSEGSKLRIVGAAELPWTFGNLRLWPGWKFRSDKPPAQALLCRLRQGTKD